MSDHTITEILKQHTENWMKIPGVVGTAIGMHDEKPCIKIYVVHLSSDLKTRFPDHIENYAVIVEETGTIEADNDLL